MFIKYLFWVEFIVTKAPVKYGGFLSLEIRLKDVVF